MIATLNTIAIFVHTDTTTNVPWFSFVGKGDWGTFPKLTALVSQHRHEMADQGQGYPWTAYGNEEQGWILVDCHGDRLRAS